MGKAIRYIGGAILCVGLVVFGIVLGKRGGLAREKPSGPVADSSTTGTGVSGAKVTTGQTQAAERRPASPEQLNAEVLPSTPSPVEPEPLPAVVVNIPPVYEGQLVNDADRTEQQGQAADVSEGRQKLQQTVAEMKEWEEVKYNDDCLSCLAQLERSAVSLERWGSDGCLDKVQYQTEKYSQWARGGRPQMISGRGMVEFSPSMVPTFEEHMGILNSLMEKRQQLTKVATAATKGPADAKPREFVNRAYSAFAAGINGRLRTLADPASDLEQRVDLGTQVEAMLSMDAFFKVLLHGQDSFPLDPMLHMMWQKDSSLKNDFKDVQEILTATGSHAPVLSRESFSSKEEYEKAFEASIRAGRPGAGPGTGVETDLARALRAEAGAKVDYTPTVEALRPAVAALTAQLQQVQAAQAAKNAELQRRAEDEQQASEAQAETWPGNWTNVAYATTGYQGALVPYPTSKTCYIKNFKFMTDPSAGAVYFRWTVIDKSIWALPMSLYFADMNGNVLFRTDMNGADRMNPQMKQPAQITGPADKIPYVRQVVAVAVNNMAGSSGTCP